LSIVPLSFTANYLYNRYLFSLNIQNPFNRSRTE
jgi:hypothetical protein